RSQKENRYTAKKQMSVISLFSTEALISQMFLFYLSCLHYQLFFYKSADGMMHCLGTLFCRYIVLGFQLLDDVLDRSIVFNTFQDFIRSLVERKIFVCSTVKGYTFFTQLGY